MTTSLPHRYRVSDRQAETYDTVTLTLKALDEPLPAFTPGQFMMLTAFGVGEVPISISGAATPDAALVHTLRSVGAVTQALHAAEPGAELGVRGPYGIGWDVAAAHGRDVVIVAGGIGLAPLWPVLLAALSRPEAFRRVILLIGARTPQDLIFNDAVMRLRDEGQVHTAITVDKASADWAGRVGVVTTLLDDAPIDPDRTEAYVCGPEIMMRFTADALRRLGVPAERIQISLERNMRCGAGLCGHCQLGPWLICRDGPVVRYDVAAPLLTVREL